MKKNFFCKMMGAVLSLVMVSACFSGCGEKTISVPAFSSSTIKIGATGPLTGEAASYGNSVNNGAKLAIKTINADGGLDGTKFSYEMMDDEALPAKTSTGYNTLKSKGMQVSIGSVTTGSCLAFAEASKKDNLFFITPSASASDVIKESNAYRICFGDPDQGVLAAQELKNKYADGKIGVIYQSDSDYSNGVFKAFQTEMGEGNFVSAVFTDSNKTTFSSQVSAMQNAGVDVIFLPMYYQEASLIITEAKNKNFKVDFLGSDGLDGLAGYLTDGSAKGVRYMTPFDVNNENQQVANFVKAYKEAFGKAPDQFAADGYDAVMVIYEALKAAKASGQEVGADSSCTVLCEAIKTQLLTMNFKGTTAPDGMTWTEGGVPTKTPVFVEIK